MNQVKAGAVLNYITIGLNTLLGLTYTPYMLRCLGQNEYGLYSLVASVIAYLTVLDLGFGNAIIRYTAKYRAEGKRTEQWEMFGMFLVIYSVIGLIALAAGSLLYFNVEALFDRTMTADDLSQARTMMVFLIINLAVTFPFSIFGSIITAFEDFVFQKVLQIARLLLSTATIVALLYFGYKAVAMVVVQTIFNMATLLINFFYCKYRLQIKIWFRGFNWPFLKEIIIYSFWIFLNAIMDRIYWSTGQFVLGAVSGTIAVAIFSVAITLQQMYMMFSTSISGVLLPRITAMVATNRSDREISDLFISTGRLQAIVMLFILSGFIIFGRGFIHVWAGPDYTLSYVITLIFFISLFIPLIQNVGINILQARNQMRFRSLCYVFIALVSLGCQICLSRIFGPVGCGLAVGGALILGQGLVMNVYYHIYQHLDILKFWREIGRMMIVPVIFILIGIISWRYVNYDNVIALIIGIVIFMFMYIPTFYVFSMNHREKELFKDPVCKIFNRFR